MRIRTVKPEFWTDSFMVQIHPLGRLIFVALWSASDDHGCIYDEPERLAMEIMPRESPLDVDHWLQFFWAAGKLNYCIAEDGTTFWEIRSWLDHQRIDHPTKCRFPREGSRKVSIPLAIRRAVAEKYKCPPGKTVDADCFYCGAPGQVSWMPLSDGRASSWVTFPGLELDHLEAEANGSEISKENIVLACRKCNRSKADANWFEHLFEVHGAALPEKFAKAREKTRELALERKGKEGKGKEGKGKGNARVTPLPENFVLSDRVLRWASQQGLAGVIGLHFEAFVSTCKAKGYTYVDWDEAFMNAVRKNWAKIQVPVQRLAV